MNYLENYNEIQTVSSAKLRLAYVVCYDSAEILSLQLDFK